MSRTYRRRRYNQLFKSDDPLMDWYATEDEIVWEDADSVSFCIGWGMLFQPRYNVKYNKNSRTGRKLISKARSDAATWKCKEPGPGWFRNLYVARPLRRKAKNEIRKFMFDENYEPMILSDPPLPYWT